MTHLLTCILLGTAYYGTLQEAEDDLDANGTCTLHTARGTQQRAAEKPLRVGRVFSKQLGWMHYFVQPTQSHYKELLR